MIVLVVTIFSLNQLANTYEAAGVPTEAEKLYREALSQAPQDYEGHILLYNLGTLYLDQKKWDESLLYYLPIYPLDIPPFLKEPYRRNLALALIGKGEAYYPLAKEIDPSVILPEGKKEEIPTLPFQKVLREAISFEQKAFIAAMRGEDGSNEQREAVEKGKLLPAAIVETQKGEYLKGCLSLDWQKVVSLAEEGRLYAERGTLRDQVLSLAAWESIFALSLDPISQEELEKQEKEQETRQKLFNMTLSDPRPDPVRVKEEVKYPW